MSLVGLGVTAALLAYVASGRRRAETEVLALVRVALWAAVAGGAGAWFEIGAIADRDEIGWVAAATDGNASGGLLRLVAAGLVAVGLFETPALVGAHESNDPGEPDDRVRWVPVGPGAIAAAGVVVGVISFVVG